MSALPAPPQAGRADTAADHNHAWNDDDAPGGAAGKQREVKIACHSGRLTGMPGLRRNCLVRGQPGDAGTPGSAGGTGRSAPGDDSRDRNRSRAARASQA
jgi:hypothetical protein